MAIIGSLVKTAENYANAPNSNSQNIISPANPLYNITMASKNMFAAIIRHGQNIYRHIMTAAFDPVYGREFSLVHQYERAATRFELAETTRPNDRSENVNLFTLLGGSYIKPNKVNPFQNTITLYDIRSQGKKGEEGPYQPYAGDYSRNYRKKDEDSSTKNKNPLKAKTSQLYRIESIAKAVEQRGREYFKSFYESHIKKNGTPKQDSNPYENRTGTSAKVAYLWQKLKDYAGGVSGYNTISKVQQQTPTYEEQDTPVTTYILPTGYSGTNTRPTSIDENLMGQEIQVPQDVLDATIKDAERFLEEQRRKKRLSLTGNESDLELALSK